MISIASFEVLDLEEPKNTEKYTLNPLPKNDDFYQQIEADFKAAGLVINKLERLRCHYSWKKYESARSNTEERTPQDPAFLLNERYLYHGTRAPKDRLCEEGFDVTLASLGCYGKGIYFSDTPLKCVKYADDTILVARVILGEIKEYEDKKRAPDLFREPEKPEPYVGWKYYDSVKVPRSICPKTIKLVLLLELRTWFVNTFHNSINIPDFATSGHGSVYRCFSGLIYWFCSSVTLKAITTLETPRLKNDQMVKYKVWSIF